MNTIANTPLPGAVRQPNYDRRALRSRIVPSASLLRDLGMDSLRVVELTLRLERALRRPIFLPEWIAGVDDPDDLTVGSLAEFLERQVACH